MIVRIQKIKLLVLFASMLLTAACSDSAMSRKEEAKRLFAECAWKAFGNGRWLSMEVDEYRFDDTVFVSHSNHISYFNDGNSPEFFIGEPFFRLYRITDDTLFLLSNQDNEIGSFSKQAENGVYGVYKHHNESKLGYLPNYYTSVFLSLKPTEQVEIESWADAVINDVSYYLFRGLSNVMYICDNATGDCDIPIQYHCEFWVNRETFQLDSLYTYKEDTVHWPYLNELAYVVKGVSHEDRSSYFDSVFDFNAPLYEKHSRHDDRFLPFSMGGTLPELETKSLLDHPMVGLNSDTITIASLDGWVLLSLWSFNCPSCIKNLQKYGKEMDSLGYRIIEKHDISILSVNYVSGNTTLIGDMASKTNTTDITFCAQGLMRRITIPYLGYYYLISPDKQIVYETSDLGDYSELLEAKANYEKQHQIK